MLVGFFLGGLVIHEGLQGWWIAPVLGSLGEIPLMLSASVLTAFNDNAANTYLSTLVPGFTENLKYAVVAGAVTGGGLTVIANAPNPAGQALLKKLLFKRNLAPAIVGVCAASPPSSWGLSFFVCDHGQHVGQQTAVNQSSQGLTNLFFKGTSCKRLVHKMNIFIPHPMGFHHIRAIA